jgi:Flp pilus assembly protein TadG
MRLTDPRRRRRARRGNSILLLTLALPVFVGFVALAVDTGMLGVAQAELSTASDAAALAGAQQLADDERLTGTANVAAEVTAANASAASIGQANSVLGVAPLIVQNTSNSAGHGDILVGYLDPTNPSSTLDTTSATEAKWNSVQVTAKRTSDHVGLVPTYFAKLMGFGGTVVSVQSTATAWPYSIKGFQGDGVNNAHLLPIVLDVTTYNDMIAGTTQDQYTWNPTTQTVSSGADGVTESVLYPVGSGSPGNWGTINVGVSNNSTSILAAQIEYGITPSQLATFPNSTISLDYSLSPPSITFSGNPGISAGIESALEAIIGQPVTIPIYDINGGNGNNAWYRVIEFAPVRILAVNFQGNPKYVIVQPALVRDPLAVAGTPQTSWTQGGLVQLYLSR